ncbi:MAG: MCE family protein [Bacteroidia bacterium]|nr:MCE family protein [Bacteroidia bacterium]MBT8279450.1 MCE family protein [Bacteroidia bacterium]NND25823.1 MCE family protein [Flavobacteriaceae bacterium]NNK60151.1 MCE family protein [Flavobacteriaceae bacterium]NNL33237.1 MCE family protein [Flavobacteriaceae bacterium]
MAISREVKTAGLVLIGLALIIFLFNYLKGENLLDSSRKFYTVFENVEGLATSAPVTINGLTVGRVQKITLDQEKNGQLMVMLLLDNDFEFSKNSTAELYETGLIGGKAIAIVPAFDDAEIARSGDMLDSEVKAGLSELLNQKLTPLQEKMEIMMVSADSVLTNINDVFDEKTKTNLQNSIAQLSATISSFKNTSQSLNGLITDNQEKLDNTLTNVDQISSNLLKITDSIASANLAQTIKNLESTIGNFDQVLASIENGEGSIGKLLKDEGLYNNLEGASKQLEQLLQDMKLNPKRYVHFSLFGKRPKQYDAEGNEIKEQKD